MTKVNSPISLVIPILWAFFLSMFPALAIAEETKWVERIEDYFQDKVGMTWTYEGSVANQVMKVNSYTNIATVKGTIQVHGVPALIFSETNQGNKGPSLSYFSTGDLGLVYHGGEPPSDFESHLIPYPVIPFPMAFHTPFIQLEKERVPFGSDFDHDGIDELADVRASVVADSYETVSVPSGVYKNALKLRGTMVVRLWLSGSDQPEWVEIVDRTTTWLVIGVGMVKGIESIEFPPVGHLPGVRTVTTELLTAFSKAPLTNNNE